MKKRVFAFILALVMVLSLVPASAFAKEEEAEETAAMHEAESTAEETIGIEAEVGDTLYYIEDGNLLSSVDSARPNTVDTDVVWVRERDGLIYYAKIDDNNTDVYKSGAGGFEKYARLFCPIDAFDVEDGFLYYSYNGEVFKLDVESGIEETVMVDEGLTGFYMDENRIKQLEYAFSIENEEIGLNSIKYSNKDEAINYIRNSDVAIKLNFEGLFEACPPSNGKRVINDSDSLKNIASGYGKDLEGKYNGSVYYNGTCVACFRFATFAYAWLFGIVGKMNQQGSITNGLNRGDLLYQKGKNRGEVNAALFREANIKSGSHIRTRNYDDADNGHSMILVDYNDDSITIYHGNANGNNDISLITLSWDEFYNQQLGGRSKGARYIYYIVTPTDSHYPIAVSNTTDWLRYEANLDTSDADTYEIKPGITEETAKANIVKREKPSLGARIVGVIVSVWNWFVGLFDSSSASSVVVLGSVSNSDGQWYLLGDNTYVLKSQFNKYYTRSNKNKGITSNLQFSGMVSPSATLKKGAWSIKGTVSSSCNIKSIKGSVVNTSTGHEAISAVVTPGTASYKLSGSKLDNNLHFEYLTPGNTYYLRYIATDYTGNFKVWTSSNFTVIGNTSAPTPSVWVESLEYGQRLVMQSSGTGALIHMTFNGGEHSGYDTITYDFTSPGTYYTDTWTTKSGAVSGHVYNTVNVSKCATPYIEDAQFNQNDATVVISGGGVIHYTTDGSTPTKASPIYTGPIHLTNSCTVKAISAQWGCANSDVAEKWQNISPPDAPSITLNTKDKLAQGKTTSVTWQPTARATSYTAIMYRGGAEVSRVTTTGTTASLLLSDRSDTENFEYQIKVYASNFKGNSPDSNTATVWGMHPVLVTFKDHIIRSEELTEDKLNEVKRRIGNHDGEVAGMTVEDNTLSVQKVDYDEYPNKPSTPSKKGFTFAGWTAGLYEPAITDKIVYGEFDINYYRVSFYDLDDHNVRSQQALSSERYMYTDEAILPDNYKVPEAYVFEGWSIDNEKSTGFDLAYIDGDIVADAAYAWGNEKLPVWVRIDSLVRKDASYTVNLSLKNNPIETTQGRVIVSLYSSGGRNLYTQICEQDVNLGTLRDWTAQPAVTLLYSGRIAYAKAYVVAVNNDKTGGALAYASQEFSDVTYDKTSNYYKNNGYWGAWSNWQDSPITAEEFLQVDEPRTVYRYRDKRFTDRNNTKSLSGWNYWYSDSYPKGEVYNGTGWVGAENTDYRKRTVRTNWVAPQYKTQYHYYRYYKGTSAPWTWANSSHPYYEEYWVDYQLPWLRYSGGMDQYGDGYTGNSGNKHWLICDGSANGGPGPWTRSVLVRDGYTEYWYTDTYYTHHFWQWDNWSSWSTTKPSSNGNREIQSKKQYRSRPWVFAYDASHEPEAGDGYVKEISGALPDMGTEYITEEEYEKGKHEYVSGPYYIKDSAAESDADKYILVADSNRDATEYRYGRWTNGTYVMPCRECAEEIYGGEWHLEWTEWSEEAAETVNEDIYACENHKEHDHNTGRYEEGMDYWNEYVVGEEPYCFMETRNENKEITYADSTKYYKVKTSLAGEVATVMVYKKINSDPTQAQMEYINEIILGEGNTYNIHINTKEMLDYFDTGDFIITLALEGGQRLVNIGTVPAEAPRYNVHFYVNGNEYTTCEVSHGQAVDINEFSFDDIEDMYPGYKFVKWDKSIVNVTEDMDVNAVMVPKTYSVVFVDYENQTTELLELAYGETLPDPVVEDVPGKVFLGWENSQAIFAAVPESIAENEALDLYYLLDDEETYIKVSEYDRTVHHLKDDTKYYKTATSATVTGNMIVTAQWKTLEYSVKFVDLDGNVISDQIVSYGQAAKLPDFIVKDGTEYTWDLSGGEWWNVTQDMVIHPYDPTPSKVAPPILDASLEEAGGSFYAELSATDANSTIYYTYDDEITQDDAKSYVENLESTGGMEEVDESGGISLFGIKLFGASEDEEEYEEGNDGYYSAADFIHEYTEPIEITEGTVIYAFTVDKDGNISPISVFEYGYDDSEDEGIIENTYEIDPDCPQITLPSLSVQPGETVTVPVTIKNNPGVTNLSLIFGYDAENLTLVSATNGDVFRGNEYSADIREDGSCKFTWLSQAVNENDGTLLTLTFKAGETAGKEKITMNIEEAVAPNEEEQPFATQDGLIRNVGDELRYGDLNGDGTPDFADAILMIRYDTGAITLTDEQKKYADLNGDGEVDFADAIRVMRFDAGLVITLR